MKLFVACFLAGAFRCVLSFDQELNDSNSNIGKEFNRALSKKLPDGYTITSGDGDYLTLVKYHPPGKNWNEARQACFYEGAFLGYPTNKEEDDLFLRIMNNNKVEDIWTGFHDFFKQGDYSTILGEVASVAAYLHWRPGQPDNSGGNERCTHLHNDGLGLNDIECSKTSYAFICKMKLPYYL